MVPLSCSSNTLNACHLTIPLTPGEGCRARSFTANRSSAQCIDWQKIRVQELMGADQQQQGRVPRSVEVRHVGVLVYCGVYGATPSVQHSGVCYVYKVYGEQQYPPSSQHLLGHDQHMDVGYIHRSVQVAQCCHTACTDCIQVALVC